MKSPESFEKDDIKKYLVSIGAYFFMPVQQGFGQQTVDILACIDGVFWGIEVKRPGKAPTPRQEAKLKAISDAGGFVAWGTSEKVIQEIKLWRNAPAADKLKFPWERSL